MATKTKVNLRDLMKKQRTDGKVGTKKVNSPLAKYNSLGQLWCVVCNAQVKSEIVWPAHIQGRKHKDNVVALKVSKTAPKPPPPEPAIVRPPPAQPKSILKRRPDDPSVYPVAKKKAKATESNSDSGLPSDFFDTSESKATQPKKQQTNDEQTQNNKNTSDNAALPADFFDSRISSSAMTSGSSDTKEASDKDKNTSKSDKNNADSNKSNMAEVLPEGFFDDPIVDAKVRKVEVKNTMEEEWGKFQKEMETQQQVSENLQEEDEEEAQIERNIDEIDEQINCFAKVEKLRDKQDEINNLKAEKLKDLPNKDSNDSDSSADEAEFDEFLDWRSKGAWK